jgi:Tol biopolymer transport system component
MPAPAPASLVRILATATAAAVVALLHPAAQAAPVQITSAGVGNTFGPSISADGQRIAFYSAANITGGNPDNSFEIVVYDRPGNRFTQISNHAGGGLTGGHQVPTISADGNRVVYQRFEIAGGFGFFQTQLHDLGTGVTQTLTPLASAGETNTLSGDGRTVAIATGNTGLRLYDVASGTLGPVIAGNTLSNALSFSGRVLASEGFGRLDVLDRDTGIWRNIAPAGSGFNMRPDLSDDGRWLAFTATYDPLGLNADRGSELFLVDLQDASVRQLTQSSAGAGSMDQVSLSGDGSRLAFVSIANLLGTNADGNQEVFVFDLLDDVLTQITQTTGFGNFSANPALDRDGSTLAFVSAANLTGGNPAGRPQLFLMDLAPQGGGSVPLPGTLPLVALAGAGLLLRRRG